MLQAPALTHEQMFTRQMCRSWEMAISLRSFLFSFSACHRRQPSQVIGLWDSLCSVEPGVRIRGGHVWDESLQIQSIPGTGWVGGDGSGVSWTREMRKWDDCIWSIGGRIFPVVIEGVSEGEIGKGREMSSRVITVARIQIVRPTPITLGRWKSVAQATSSIYPCLTPEGPTPNDDVERSNSPLLLCLTRLSRTHTKVTLMLLLPTCHFQPPSLSIPQ